MANTVEEHQKGDLEQQPIPTAKPLDGPEYSIYNYFRKNTGFTIAFISALVAVATFSLNYATILHNHAYLRFWNVDIVYAKSQDIGVFYTAFGVFVYYFLLMLSQVMLGMTISVYAYYNKEILVQRALCRQLKRDRKICLRIRKKYYRLLKKAKDNTSFKEELEGGINEANEIVVSIDEILNDDEDTHSYKARLTVNIIGTCLISIGLCLFGALALTVSYENKTKIFMVCLLSLFPTIFSLALHTISNWKKVKLDKFIDNDLQNTGDAETAKSIPLFPVEGLLHGGLKYHATNNKLLALVVQYIVTIVVCVSLLASTGKNSAEQKKDFPIWRDGSTTYAVIYNNGTQIILEPIIIDGDCATIDTNTQRILTSDDITYETQSFENISKPLGD